MLHSPEVGTHFISQTGQAIKQFGIIPEHFVILRFLVHDVMIHFAPAFLEQGSALNLDVLTLILDNIMQGSVDAIGNDLDLVSVIDLAVTGALVSSGRSAR